MPSASDVTNAVNAAVPQPGSTVPGMDTNTGAVGSAAAYMRADSVRPRITRSLTAITAADGTFTADWSAMPLTSSGTQVNGIVTLTPIYSGKDVPKCRLTSAPTATQAKGMCVTEKAAQLTLAIVTTGITVNSAASSMTVEIQVYPPTQ